jgi:hypothetical protein
MHAPCAYCADLRIFSLKGKRYFPSRMMRPSQCLPFISLLFLFWQAHARYLAGAALSALVAGDCSRLAIPMFSAFLAAHAATGSSAKLAIRFLNLNSLGFFGMLGGLGFWNCRGGLVRWYGLLRTSLGYEARNEYQR